MQGVAHGWGGGKAQVITMDTAQTTKCALHLSVPPVTGKELEKLSKEKTHTAIFTAMQFKIVWPGGEASERKPAGRTFPASPKFVLHMLQQLLCSDMENWLQTY